MFCYRVQNLSINGRVFFLEEGHKYYRGWCRTIQFYLLKIASMLSDLRQDWSRIFMRSLILYQRLRSMYTSQALHYVGAACLGHAWGWLLLRGQHGYGESLFNKWECRRLTCQDTLCGGSTQRADIKYVLAKTELLVYSLEWRDRWIYWCVMKTLQSTTF
jgi:hypothetical protein